MLHSTIKDILFIVLILLLIQHFCNVFYILYPYILKKNYSFPLYPASILWVNIIIKHAIRKHKCATSQISTQAMKSTQLHAVSLAEQSERMEHQTLRSLYTSFASSTVTNLIYIPFGRSSCFLRHIPLVSLILCFRRSTEVSPYYITAALFYASGIRRTVGNRQTEYLNSRFPGCFGLPWLP